MSLSEEEARRLYQAIGELQANMGEIARQRDVLFDEIKQLGAAVRDLRIDVAEHRQEFKDHTEDEEEIAALMRDYRAVKNKAIGVLAATGLLATFLGVAVSTWVKTVVERLIH